MRPRGGLVDVLLLLLHVDTFLGLESTFLSCSRRARHDLTLGWNVESYLCARAILSLRRSWSADIRKWRCFGLRCPQNKIFFSGTRHQEYKMATTPRRSSELRGPMKHHIFQSGHFRNLFNLAHHHQTPSLIVHPLPHTPQIQTSRRKRILK